MVKGGPGGAVTVEVRRHCDTSGFPTWSMTIEDRLSATTVTGGLCHAGANSREAERDSNDLRGVIEIVAGCGHGKTRHGRREGIEVGGRVSMGTI